MLFLLVFVVSSLLPAQTLANHRASKNSSSVTESSSNDDDSWGIEQVAGGAQYSFPVDKSYEALKPSLGFVAEVTYTSETLGRYMSFHFTGSYQPYAVRTTGQTASLNQVSFTGGLQVHSDIASYRFPVHPFFGVEVGGVYSFLSIKDATNATQNAGVNFVSLVRPGMIVEVMDPITFNLSLPFGMIWASKSMMYWSAVGTIGISL